MHPSRRRPGSPPCANSGGGGSPGGLLKLSEVRHAEGVETMKNPLPLDSELLVALGLGKRLRPNGTQWA
eukprot:5520446-Pyramimonas_sp.AAC.1